MCDKPTNAGGAALEAKKGDEIIHDTRDIFNKGREIQTECFSTEAFTEKNKLKKRSLNHKDTNCLLALWLPVTNYDEVKRKRSIAHDD